MEKRGNSVLIKENGSADGVETRLEEVSCGVTLKSIRIRGGGTAHGQLAGFDDKGSGRM